MSDPNMSENTSAISLESPHAVGRKFYADGMVRQWPGNTFVGHAGQQGEDFAAFDALLNIYRQMPRHSFAKKITMLPPSSYHITVFGALNEEDRGTERWPTQLDPATPLEVVTQDWLRQLQKWPPLEPAVFEFEVLAPQRTSSDAPHVPLRPADAATAQRLRDLRNQLSSLTGIRQPDHETYAYHLTLGYLIQNLSPQESADLYAVSLEWMAQLPSRLRITSVAFCSFRDMFAFQELHLL
jgi:hypothetical protein